MTKVLPRMTLFGALPPSILPILIAIRDLLDVPKAPNRKTLRLVHYLIQLAAGDGSGGTVVPFSPLAGGLAVLYSSRHDAACDTGVGSGQG